ncbi:C-factor-like [Spea bombifrons]|uniref:C-factor-like n=1 Tax=Spea bombifrons TaxID=233779 RepID=UPI00234BCE5A|nr:C-factor-like [Spea bombifrons]
MVSERMASLRINSVLVTGSNRGIGLELVKRFLEKVNPQHVFATCRNPEGAQELKSLAAHHPNLEVIQLEVTDRNCIKAAYHVIEKKLNGRGLNMLINNAAIAMENTVETADENEMINSFKTNTIAPMILTQEFLPLLNKAAQENASMKNSCNKASVINITSSLGSVGDVPSFYANYPKIGYRCSKAALNMLTRCQTEAHKGSGILFVALHPGWVQTDMGGPMAPMTVQESVSGIVGVLETLSEEQNGLFLDWKGDQIPW